MGWHLSAEIENYEISRRVNFICIICMRRTPTRSHLTLSEFAYVNCKYNIARNKMQNSNRHWTLLLILMVTLSTLFFDLIACVWHWPQTNFSHWANADYTIYLYWMDGWLAGWLVGWLFRCAMHQVAMLLYIILQKMTISQMKLFNTVNQQKV